MGELRPVLRLNLSGCGIGPDKALEADRYNAALDMAAYADTHGFAIVNVEEHHDVDIGWMGSPLTMAAAIAARTSRVQIRGSAVLVTLYDPLRLAEEMAVLDLISRGRFVLVAGQGYRPSEYAMMDRDFAARGQTMDPLGILFGHGKIERDLYDAGLRLEKARAACFGAGAAAERDIYGMQMTMASIGGRRAVVTNPADEDSAKREMRMEAEYDRLLAALHRCGPAVAAATLGIATRPFAGAWVVVPLATRDRPWTARHDTRLALIKEGLAAIEKLGSREL